MVALKSFPIQSKYQCNYYRVIISVIIAVNIWWETYCKWKQTNVEVSWMLFQSIRCQLWKSNNCCLRHNGNSSLSWLVWDFPPTVSKQYLKKYEFATMSLKLWVCNYEKATITVSDIIQIWVMFEMYAKKSLGLLSRDCWVEIVDSKRDLDLLQKATGKLI